MVRVFRFAIGLTWLINGLFCKLMNGVPRHPEIIATILGESHLNILVVLIGSGEMIIAFWIWSGRYLIACAWLQITLVLTMNIIEQIMVPELLLWGHWNLLWALGFCALIWFTLIRKVKTTC